MEPIDRYTKNVRAAWSKESAARKAEHRREGLEIIANHHDRAAAYWIKASEAAADLGDTIAYDEALEAAAYASQLADAYSGR
jgi:hypothetical protein